MSRPWRRRQPVAAGFIAGSVAYLLFGITLQLFGGADPEQAWGLTTALGAAIIWFIAWAVYSRDPDDGSDSAPES